MFLKFSALAAFMLNASVLTGANSVALQQHDHEDRKLQASPSCAAYPIEYQTTSGTTIFWTNGGGSDPEWLNTANWQYGYLPGIHKFNRLIMATGDAATVHCDATYMVADVSLEARAGATLDVTADLNIGDQLVLKTNAAVTQSSTSSVSIGKNLYLAASYSMSDAASLSIGLDMYMASNAKFAIVGDGTSIIASTEVDTQSQIHGEVKFVLGPSGTGTFDLGAGALEIGSTTAKLIIDATSYSGGSASIPLIKYTSSTGSFGASNIDILGLSGGMTGTVVQESNGLFLVLDGGEPVTAKPTGHPTMAPPVTGQPSDSPTKKPSGSPSVKPTPSPTNEPTTDSPTSKPTSEPTKKPTEPVPTLYPTDAPTTMSPTPLPTNAPSPKPTSYPSQSPIVSPTFSPVETDDSITLIKLSANGLDSPIVSSGTCPAPEASAVIIDGSDYTAGPGTITLYECSSIDANFDLLKIRLENFPEGLWYELAYKTGIIELVTKSLADYTEYHILVKRRFGPTQEYPESTENERNHFPTFNWNKIPTWIRYYKALRETNKPNLNVWNDTELQSISTHHLSWYGLGSPDHVKGTLGRIKSFNENHTTLLYWNAESYWGSWDLPGFAGEPYLDCCNFGTGGRRLYDWSVPAMQDWWVQHAKNMAQDPSIDGIFTDNTMSRECKNEACDEKLTDKSLTIQRLAEDLDSPAHKALDIGNYLRQEFNAGNRFRMPYVDGSYFENQHKGVSRQMRERPWEPIIVSMQLAREASWKKKVVMWTGSRRNCGCGFNNPEFPEEDIPDLCKPILSSEIPAGTVPTDFLREDMHKALGEFLMIVEEWSYINFSVSPHADCESWRWNVNEMGLDEFNRPLGRPLGPPLKSGHTFSRHFEHLSVKMNTFTEETEFIWH